MLVKNTNDFFTKFIVVLFISVFGILSLFFISPTISAENNNFVKCDFKRPLKIGTQGLDVFCLNVFLYKEGFLKKSLMNYVLYDRETQKAVKRWQIQNKIFPANGIFDTSSISFYDAKYKNYFVTDEKTKLMKLPEVKDEEIQILPNGYSDAIEYVRFYLTGIDFTPDIKDDPKLFQYAWNLLEEFRRKKEIPSFSSYPYIKDFLENKNSNKEDLVQKLSLLKKIREIEIRELKKIKIASNLKDLHKKFIINAYLDIILINDFFKYLEGEISKDNFLVILNDYESYKNKLSKEVIKMVLASNKPTASKYQFFIKEAKAQSLFYRPFGGKITFIFNCDCPFSLADLVFIGPPRPAIVLVPYWFLGSPLNYLWKNITTVGVWTLGLYFRFPPPCLVGKACLPAPYQPDGLIFMSGTSLY